MSNPSIRYAACNALAGRLHELLAPQGVHNLNAIPADPEKKACYPYITIIPRVFTFEPFQDDEVKYSSDDSLLVEVGSFEGTAEMRLGAQTAAQREELGDIIINEFLAQEGRPGVLVLQLPELRVLGRPTLYTAPVSFILDKDQWMEEMVFDKKRFSYTDLQVSLPALVLRAEVYNMDTLQSVLTEDLTSEDPTDTETVTINEDGEISP